jgi:hypothetical protein
MKSLWSRIQRWRGCAVSTIFNVSPACDEDVNLARKLSTEFIDIGRHVIVKGS